VQKACSSAKHLGETPGGLGSSSDFLIGPFLSLSQPQRCKKPALLINVHLCKDGVAVSRLTSS
jgi:hypothetical protein